MSSKTKRQKGIEPKLRFPEFGNAEGWSAVNIGSVASKKKKWSFTGGPFGSNLKSSDYTENGIRVIQLQNIGDGHFVNDCKIFTSKEKADELLSCNIYPGEIILSKMGDPVARACLIPDHHTRYVMCSDGIRLAVDESSFDNFFIFSLLNSKTFRALAEKSSTGSTRKRIGIDVLRNLEITVPKLQEQVKIAGCLSSLDELIEAEDQKLDAIQQHKKGLMQELFPAEGETIPNRRFPKFKNAPEWKETLLGDVCKFVRGPFGGALKKEIFVKEGYAVYEQMHAIHQDFKSFRYYIDENKFKELKRFSVSPGDLIMSCSGTMGKFAIVPDDAKQGVINQALLKLSVKKNYNLQFIKEILELPNNQAQILSQAGGGAIKNVASVDQIKGIKFYVPVEDEQQHIADFLSSIDDLINAQSQKLAALRNHKTGLMQQLFPTVNEVQDE